jgi:hypothetical protein
VAVSSLSGPAWFSPVRARHKPSIGPVSVQPNHRIVPEPLSMSRGGARTRINQFFLLFHKEYLYYFFIKISILYLSIEYQKHIFTTGIMNIPVGHFNSRRPLLRPTGIR